MKKLLPILCLTLFAVACSSDKAPIEGERISILQQSENLRASYRDVKVSLPQPKQNSSWSMSGGSANHYMGHLAARDNLKKAWSESFGSGTSSRDVLITVPVIAAGKVFTLDAEAKASAFDLKTGKKLWHKNIKAKNKNDRNTSMKGAGIAYMNNKIIVTTGFGDVVALNEENGQKVWQQSFEVPFRTAPTVGGNKVFVQNLTNVLYALDIETGEELWAYHSAKEDTTLTGGASPAYEASLDVVVAAFTNGELRALVASTGAPLWADNLTSIRKVDAISSITAVKANPVIHNGVVYAIGNARQLVAVDLRTGTRIWEKEVSSTNQPWVAGRFVYVLTNAPEIVAIEAASGDIAWVKALPSFEDEEDMKGYIIWSGPVLVSNRILVTGSNGLAYSLSPYTGDTLGYIDLDEPMEMTPIVADGTVLFTTTDAEIVAYR